MCVEVVFLQLNGVQETAGVYSTQQYKITAANKIIWLRTVQMFRDSIMITIPGDFPHCGVEYMLTQGPGTYDSLTCVSLSLKDEIFKLFYLCFSVPQLRRK